LSKWTYVHQLAQLVVLLPPPTLPATQTEERSSPALSEAGRLGREKRADIRRQAAL